MQIPKTKDNEHYGGKHFIGAAGQFYVAHCLTRHHFHAAITLGNAPDVDIIVADVSGSAALSIQVKTATDACGRPHFGRAAGEWRVSRSVYKSKSERLWYALVDMPTDKSKLPVVFLVPSIWIANFLELQMTDQEIRSHYPTLCTRAAAFYYLVKELWDGCEERWDRIRDFLRHDPAVLDWCNSSPLAGQDWKDKRRWGKCAR